MTPNRKPLAPATPSMAWLCKPNESRENGVLTIDDSPYLLSPVYDRKTGPKRDRTVVSWVLRNGEGEVYDVTPARPVWSCDCGDYTFNRANAPTAELRECKHIRCLQVLLPLAGIWPLPKAELPVHPEHERQPESELRDPADTDVWPDPDYSEVYDHP